MKSNNLLITEKGDLIYITFPKLTECGAVRHVFSTRSGGVSTGDCASMNLSFNKDTNRENVLKNYEILCTAVGIDTSHLVLSHQTHTNNVLCVTTDDCGTGITKPSFSDIDGLITNEPGVALVTQFADCTPLLFCDPVKKVIATSHAGWKGTVKLIGKVTVEKMVNEYGCDPKNIIAGIGPCIGKCCYEVDDPVYNEIVKIPFLNLDKILSPKDNGKYMLDLVETNRQILIHSGIKAENIDVSDICTCCNSNSLHSHRATKGKRGNLAAIIELKD
ncbi:MAG: peptidoglycan editing factor PgeF [Clostridia bacterium]|nr:peptidoglycan editing factor PgeF [Clostridia bacterium]